MNEGKDIVGISVPFTAGVSFAALCSVYCTKILENSFIIFWLPGIAFFLCCALIVFSLLTRPRKYVFYIVLFLALGCFCYINGNITVSLRKDAGGLAAMAEKSATRVKAVIESIPYTNEETTGVVKALTTGDKSGLGRATTGTFRRSGTPSWHYLYATAMAYGPARQVPCRRQAPEPAARRPVRLFCNSHRPLPLNNARLLLYHYQRNIQAALPTAKAAAYPLHGTNAPTRNFPGNYPLARLSTPISCNDRNSDSISETRIVVSLRKQSRQIQFAT